MERGEAFSRCFTFIYNRACIPDVAERRPDDVTLKARRQRCLKGFPPLCRDVKLLIVARQEARAQLFLGDISYLPDALRL